MEDVAKPHALMEDIIAWAGDSPTHWGTLLETVRSRYAAPRPFTLEKLTPREVLLCWAGNRYSYARGLFNSHSPDISFYGRVVKRLENHVPEALLVDHGMAKTLALKIMKRNVVVEVEEP